MPIVTIQKLEGADVDVKSIGEAANEKKIVNPRYGAPYKSVPLVVEDLQAKADQVIAQGFYTGYSTEALLLAAKPVVAEMRARADDTRKIWRWNRTSAEGVVPVTGTWTDTGPSDVDKAVEEFLEEIRKQGVALDQLDEYYNYLMQRLAQIAVDKGWEASFVVDASGKSQQQINNANPVISASLYGLIPNPTLDQSTKLQEIANIAKAKNAELFIDTGGLDSATYVAHNIDIAGLIVTVQNGVTFEPPITANGGHTFVAKGTEELPILKKTKLTKAVLNGLEIADGVFDCEYALSPEVVDCKSDNVPIQNARNGNAVRFFECINPKALGGEYKGGKVAVLFHGCTKPLARDVVTDGQGLDGILFYSSKDNGTTTTDALSDNCQASRYNLNGEDGRAGIHFYGVRRGTAIATRAFDDSESPARNGTGALRFRDCEDYNAIGYNIDDVGIGILVNHLGDYEGSPHFIKTRGSIGAGNIVKTVKNGIAVETPGKECSVLGSQIHETAQINDASGGGIYFNASGSVSGCTVEDGDNVGGIYISANADASITANILKNTGNTGSVPQIRVAGRASISGNTFKSDDGVSILAIRGIGAAKLTIGQNNYDDSIKNQLTLDSTATLLNGSSVLKLEFNGLPSVAGIFQDGTKLYTPNNTFFVRENGVWVREQARVLTSTIETTQTTVAHGLGYVPKFISITAKSNANVWQSANADATNVYLTASANSTPVNINVR